MSNVQAVSDIYNAMGQGDVAAIFGAMDPAIEWREAEGNPYSPGGEAWVGTDAILENLFIKLISEWDGFAINQLRIHDAGDVVVMEGRYTGTYKETGKSLDAQVCHVWTLRDGKVVGFQQYVDTGQWQAAVNAASN